MQRKQRRKLAAWLPLFSHMPKAGFLITRLISKHLRYELHFLNWLTYSMVWSNLVSFVYYNGTTVRQRDNC